MSKSRCGCVYADAKNTASVRLGYEMGGYLKEPCAKHDRMTQPMSSKMRYTDDDLRVIVQDWSESDPDQAVAINLARECLRHRALLARTEAGPSLLCQSDACAHKGTAHNFCTPRTEAGADGVCDGGNNHDWRGDGICDRCGATYTHPQDASGDAREAERYRWLRDEASRAQLEMFADRRGTRLAADRLCDAGIDIAMQAKEPAE